MHSPPSFLVIIFILIDADYKGIVRPSEYNRSHHGKNSWAQKGTERMRRLENGQHLGRYPVPSV